MPSVKIQRPSLVQLDRALAKVSDELHELGLWTDFCEHVDVTLGAIGEPYGFYRSVVSGEPGEIVIPWFSISKLQDQWYGDYTSLADVLRHEFAHALGNMNRGLVRARQFSDVFDGAHDSDIEFEFNQVCHVTEYASTKPSEDFAEVFMIFLRSKGRIPQNLDVPAIRRRWNFIKKFCINVRTGRRRWQNKK